ncbi:hypothetical protein PABG_11687 [Paracoccidioides brasiliensis Pb03]|uniref:Uncharacterized protein n=2 Tax=Paracoccidioides brasiliensis TaxID=121759 RepID=A0A0A0HTD2_PARBD|nr:uncharacterized protein PADG_11295 [Paracoccidioides brasiliensis Pb18]KGM92474.1 hypothetical protein PADG_11295 [Paracoccidioides brasiliensis Pb18]KGY15382.1 hypothetical protein PABG_11687 [Paracoccidioides brasiliensis Pb03]ODH45466.1 hypothetical protein ACO22_00036 [Paracoccidioides brasiliensis]ODH49338.1 hypothetical protein GX48_04549 [Paracoccidioides brasiliensis]
MATNSIKLLTGNSHPELAQLVADRYLHRVYLADLLSVAVSRGVDALQPQLERMLPDLELS